MPARAVAAAAAWGGALQLLFAAGCARMEPAPGGPPDHAPPRLLAVYPDTVTMPRDFHSEVEFRFDEVIAEGGPTQGGKELERLVILSPTTRTPKVRWRRNRITVAPAEGWEPNRVYRVQLLPGVTDLRRNQSDSGVTVTFTTGASAPQTTVTGTVIDWTTRRPVPVALVVALLLPDSLRYRGLTDSSGAFSLGPLPRGKYLVYGVIDQNRDHQQDTREAFDTVRLAAGATEVGELWAFAHDSAPPRIASVAVDDSLSATISFSQMLDPQQKFDIAAVRLRRLPDSTTVAVTSILPPSIDDSLHRRPEPADTAARDTLPPVPAPIPPPVRAGAQELPLHTSRPALFDRLVLRVAEPWRPGGRYALEIRGVRNVTGKATNVQSVIVVPEQKALPDTLSPLLPKPKPPTAPKRP